MSVDMDYIEQKIQAKALTAPRITPADIEASIASEHYFTASQGIFGERSCARPGLSVNPPPADASTTLALSLLTICVLELRNGFTVTGESACASPENFNAEIGRKIARQKAVEKIWPLLGYALREKLSAEPKDFRGRVRQEYAELDDRIKKLLAFRATDAFAALDLAEQHRLDAQYAAMCDYSNVLAERIQSFGNEGSA